MSESKKSKLARHCADRYTHTPIHTQNTDHSLSPYLFAFFLESLHSKTVTKGKLPSQEWSDVRRARAWGDMLSPDHTQRAVVGPVEIKPAVKPLQREEF